MSWSCSKGALPTHVMQQGHTSLHAGTHVTAHVLQQGCTAQIRTHLLIRSPDTSGGGSSELGGCSGMACCQPRSWKNWLA